MRQIDDIQYGLLLNRVRIGEAWNGFNCQPDISYPDPDCKVLLDRQLAVLMARDPSARSRFQDAPIIVGTRAIRDVLNLKKTRDFAIATQQELHIYYAKDRHSYKELCGADQQHIWHIKSSTTRDVMGELPLVIGMPVMVTENLAIQQNVVNGSEGRLVGLRFETDSTGHRYAVAAHVLIPGCDLQAPGLSPNIVPILPVRSRFTCKLSRSSKEITISRLQLPLVPAYAYTDYKSQGRSLEKAIIDLASSRSLQGVYVMLSRVKTLDGLAILRCFHPNKINQRLSEEIRDELSRIARLDEVTVSR